MGGKRASASGCPCGNARDYAHCCGRWHAGEPVPDAEALMRSRYSAYVLGLVGYLLATWHPDTRPGALELQASSVLTWLGLTVRAHRRTDEHHADVEFVARCRIGGRPAQRLHERSHFVQQDGRWYYVDGDDLG